MISSGDVRPSSCTFTAVQQSSTDGVFVRFGCYLGVPAWLLLPWNYGLSVIMRKTKNDIEKKNDVDDLLFCNHEERAVISRIYCV